ncbi:N(2)-fixation sustaining protein CowN [Imhoffiella purpurea]|uniref:N(2)-fixation sustaining protein CowN n=1 Tax=Imhoffiella purpurea TaxID=1249627 RepID=W9VCA9_9GAMM|nr:N(2)-fixation sustaining protein CowN [Imhoffiella purpurea]EXJ17228.1 hypothetical protein D779_0055 [Imhoffiella purpurea]
MQSTAAKVDRYVTFEGIECDDYARQVVVYIRDCLADGDRPSAWQDYFERKLIENAGMGQDELFLVGSQVNYIRELFEHYQHAEGLDLLDKIEEECC